MANMASASLDFQFTLKFNEVAKELREFLTLAGMHKALVYANFFIAKESTPEALGEARELARHAGAGDKTEAWAQQLVDLHVAAERAKPTIATRLAAVDGLHLSADLLHWEGTAHERLEQEQLRVYAGRGLADLPRQWQGKRYRRTL